MDKHSKHPRSTNIIAGHWRQSAQPVPQATHSDAQHSDELEALATIARSTIADLEHYDEPGASARLQDASRRFAELGEQLRSAQGEALSSVNRLARRHPVLLAGGAIALGFAMVRLLGKRHEARGIQGGSDA